LEGPALKTGVLFQEQTAESLSAAVRKLEAESFDTIAMHAFALGFDREIYKLKMKEYILKRWEGFQAGSPQPQVVKHVSSTRR
jgi:hypothetical protein